MDTLDTSQNQAGRQLVDVNAGLALIKAEMPVTYAAIQAWSKRIGNDAFRQVRRGLAGEWFCFFAHEAGNMVGTPWASIDEGEQAVWLTHFGGVVMHVQLGMGAPA